MAHLEGGAACEKNKAEHGGGAEAGREGGGRRARGRGAPSRQGEGLTSQKLDSKGGRGWLYVASCSAQRRLEG